MTFSFVRSATDAATIGADLTGTSHVLEFLTQSGHYHFGRFAQSTRGDAVRRCPDARDELRSALDRLALQDVDALNPRQPVLDVGSGNGGTTRMLAARGYDALGIDPSRGSIGYSRRVARRDGSPAVFTRVDLQSFASATRAKPFGSALATEVSQHFDSVGHLLHYLRPLMHSTATVLMRDVFTVHCLPRKHAPYHAVSNFVADVHRAGFEFTRLQDISSEVAPTVRYTRSLLSFERTRLRRAFRRRPTIDVEADAVDSNLAMLGRAFHNGDIRYLTTVLTRRP